MATPRTLRPLVQTCRRISPSAPSHRTFLPNPFADTSSSPQTLTAHRVLPYPSAPIYSIIADVPSYASFLPYCTRSDITHWSLPDKVYKRHWPSQGTLTSGFGGITESFVSRVYCVPGKYVESVGGDTETSLAPDEIAHHLEAEGGDATRAVAGGDGGLLRHLRSRWMVEDMGRDKTGVSLALEFAFANPFYAALSGGVADKVVDVMIRAFEQRVVKLLTENPDMVKAGLADLDGSRLKT
ncbi:Coenzyme Q-binding protein coq10, mitochondrial [Pleosporales sp. CAS-2024a]